MLTNQSDHLGTLNVTNLGKIILAGQWKLNFNNVSTLESKKDNNDTELQITGFEANFMAISSDGTGTHTRDIKLKTHSNRRKQQFSKSKSNEE